MLQLTNLVQLGGIDVESLLIDSDGLEPIELGHRDLKFPLTLLSCGPLWVGNKAPFGSLYLAYSHNRDEYTIIGANTRLIGEPKALVSFDPTAIIEASFDNISSKILLKMVTKWGTSLVYMWMKTPEVADALLKHLLALEGSRSGLTDKSFDTNHLTEYDCLSQQDIE